MNISPLTMSSLKIRYLAYPLAHHEGNTDPHRRKERTHHTIGPLVDLKTLKGSTKDRSLAVDYIGKACQQNGFFQVINHGISVSVTSNALVAAKSFFELPTEEKMELASDDITRPVRFGPSNRRSFLKQYSHPLKDWVDLWPSKPVKFRENMGRYAVEVRNVALQVMETILESLGLGRSYMHKELENGLQVMAINGYPVHRNSELRQNPDLKLGFPPHTDYSIITVILPSSGGLEQFDSRTDKWYSVQQVPGSLLVQVGNYLEVLSNGIYKSAVHRVTLRPSKSMRISLASLHSFAIDEKVEVAKELVDDQHPRGYRSSSFRGFLNFLSSQDEQGKERSYLDTLKINEG